MSDFKHDKKILSELAKQVKDVASKPIQSERRENWRKLNSLKMARPMINVNYFMWWQEVYDDASTLKCIHPYARRAERDLLQALFHDRVGDDTVIEPWITIRCVYGAPYINTPDEGDMYYAINTWGLKFSKKEAPIEGGAWAFDPALKELDDFRKMVEPFHTIDEQKTVENFAYINEAIGNEIGVVVDRGPMIRTYCGSLLHDLCKLRGLEQMMMDIYDNPEWLHQVLDFMERGVHNLHAQCEKAGDLRLINTFNQTMTYCEELPDPSVDTNPVNRKQLWHYYEGQEFEHVSPGDTNEFCIEYHKKLATEYGMIAYGCCENLTKKIPYLQSIPNLRIIAVSPWANVSECAEQIGKEYVMSYRPSPAETLCNGFSKSNFKKYLKQGLRDAGSCNLEINLKDVLTIRKDVNALCEWVKVAQEIAHEHGSCR